MNRSLLRTAPRPQEIIYRRPVPGFPRLARGRAQGSPTPVAFDDKEKSQRLFMTLIMTFGFFSDLDRPKLLIMIYLRRGRESNP